MYTVIETATFVQYAEKVWNAEDRAEFITWIASYPEQGDVIPHTQGLRKVRWARQGTGKQGGSRVIYFNRLSNGEIWLLIVYSKAKFDNLPLSMLQQLREELNNGR